MAIGKIVFVEDPKFAQSYNYQKYKYVDLYFSCKKECDETLENKYNRMGYTTRCEDISDTMTHNRFLSWNMSVINRIRNGEDEYSNEAFEKLKLFASRVSQLIRKRTYAETESLRQLADLPDYT